jgi:hypothetical protein
MEDRSVTCFPLVDEPKKKLKALPDVRFTGLALALPKGNKSVIFITFSSYRTKRPLVS